MSVAIDVYYAWPIDSHHETRIEATAARHDGKVTFREEPFDMTVTRAICLTIEFPDWPKAESATAELQLQGEHVEGPMEYGDD